MADTYALSLKQPWAALLVHGLKSIEVRNWPTPRRGRILIHAARIPDPRPEAWAHIDTPQLKAAAELAGGIIGAAELTGCREYRTPEAFAADQPRHLNDPAWFKPPVLYGFTFAAMEMLPFRRLPGWMRFFPVPAPEPKP
ncbi:MAG TPA: ASCH domain-containing protein [Gemmataceae bacterium]|jgi:hypothetical protein|nr:ASCH domain-containing protein [Gemmataceae bacterium]